MYHDTAVAEGPAFASFHLFPHKAVFCSYYIIRVRGFIENMAVVLCKFFIPVIIHHHFFVFDGEGIGVVIVQLVTFDFNVPTVQVLLVEKLFPFFLGGRDLG
ncbi:hypothetical protein FQZ97_1119430 [compost metagenome]